MVLSSWWPLLPGFTEENSIEKKLAQATQQKQGSSRGSLVETVQMHHSGELIGINWAKATRWETQVVNCWD